MRGVIVTCWATWFCCEVTIVLAIVQVSMCYRTGVWCWVWDGIDRYGSELRLILGNILVTRLSVARCDFMGSSIVCLVLLVLLLSLVTANLMCI